MTSLSLLLGTLKECKNVNSLRRQMRDVAGSWVGLTRIVFGILWELEPLEDWSVSLTTCRWVSSGDGRGSSGGRFPLIRKSGSVLWVSPRHRRGFCFSLCIWTMGNMRRREFFFALRVCSVLKTRVVGCPRKAPDLAVPGTRAASGWGELWPPGRALLRGRASSAQHWERRPGRSWWGLAACRFARRYVPCLGVRVSLNLILIDPYFTSYTKKKSI